jgi:hypothetical protein
MIYFPNWRRNDRIPYSTAQHLGRSLRRTSPVDTQSLEGT